MIRSMTSYGRACDVVRGKNLYVELKSVNNRFFDCTVKISKIYGCLEEKIKAYLQQKGISRGKVEVYVSIDVLEDTETEIHLDLAYTKSYIEALRRLRETFGLRDDISVMTVAQNRDIFTMIKHDEDADRDWQILQPVLDGAIGAFQIMREAEGERIRADLLDKEENIKKLAGRISAIQGRAAEAYRLRLETRLRQLISELDLKLPENQSRIITECAIFADKTAIDEELTRLDSHFSAFEDALQSAEPVGRKIDFLLQEMNREVNTIGSKASDVEITALVVQIKSELEKIREQIQNIE